MEGKEVMVSVELLEALAENTETLIAEFAWMANSRRGVATLGLLRREAAEARRIVEALSNSYHTVSDCQSISITD